MDGNGNMNLGNWGHKSHLGLQLMSSPIAEKPLFGVRDHLHVNPSPVMASTNGGPFHHHRIEPHVPIDYWTNQNHREKFFNAYYQSNYGFPPESSSAHSIQMAHHINLPKNDDIVSEMDELCEERENSDVAGKKRGAVSVKEPKEKKQRTRMPRAPREAPNPSLAHRARAPKKRAEIVINGITMDISDIPTPVCSCTGTPQQCYRWGSGGWQSACCTTGLSTYPLPMSMKRRGARIAGRKMSIGAFKKVLEKLTSEGYDFSSPIDLRSFWAKHGTNKFVTIR